MPFFQPLLEVLIKINFYGLKSFGVLGKTVFYWSVADGF